MRAPRPRHQTASVRTPSARMLELFLFGFLAGLLDRPLNCFLFRLLSGQLLCVGRFDLLRPPLLFHWPVTATLRKVRGGYDGRLRNISDRRTARLYRIAPVSYTHLRAHETDS